MSRRVSIVGGVPGAVAAVLQVTLLILVALQPAGCGREPPEVRVRRAIEAGRDAATSGDPKRLGDWVSDRYSDGAGRDRTELLQQVGVYLAYLQPVHILYKEESLGLTGTGRAHVTLLVAVASVPMESLADLKRISADIGRVDLAFEEEGGEWKLVRADWSPASLTDWF